MATRSLQVPQISQADMTAFHDAHFSQLATLDFHAHFLQPDASNASHPTPGGVEDDHYNEDEDGLGYYADGVKRTITDEQVAIFRHSELEALRRARESTRIKKATIPDDLSDGEISSTLASAPKKKKKRRRGKNHKPDEEPIDLRKRTWDVVEKGLATLDYGEEEHNQTAPSNAAQRRRISYED